MNTKRFGIGKAVLVGLISLSPYTASEAEIIDVKWDASGKFERTHTITPGKFVEICEKLLKGSAVDWQFNVSTPVNFNIHFHQGKDVSFPEKQDSVSERRGTLVAPSSEDYCWMWSNKGDSPSKIRVMLTKTASKQ
jgi:hypothetical protein